MCSTFTDAAENENRKPEVVKIEEYQFSTPTSNITKRGLLEVIKFSDGRELTCIESFAGYTGSSSISCNWEAFNQQKSKK